MSVPDGRTDADGPAIRNGVRFRWERTYIGVIMYCTPNFHTIRNEIKPNQGLSDPFFENGQMKLPSKTEGTMETPSSLNDMTRL